MTRASLIEEMVKEITVVDVLADEIRRICWDIFIPPFMVKEGHGTEDIVTIEVDCNHDWCHSFASRNLVRFGKMIITPNHIKIGQFDSDVTIPLSDPKLFELSIQMIHNDVTAGIMNQVEVKECNQAECPDGVTIDDGQQTVGCPYCDGLANQIKLCLKTVELFDLRYLAHMYRTKYLGWELIPDYVTVGMERDNGSPPVGRRPYRKKQILDEMHDPCKWQEDPTKVLDNVDGFT